MEFYGRELELAELTSIRERSHRQATMTVVTGRRRMGKTRLLIESLKDQEYLYFFVARRDERLLCEEFTRQLKEKLDVPIYGSISTFSEVFRLLLETAATRHLNVIIDEFQEFLRINPSVYSMMQGLWDEYRFTRNIKMNLILCGSVQSLMVRLFDDYEEPLYGRASAKLSLQPLSLTTLREVMQLVVDYTPRDLLTLYTLSGGVPYYVEQFVDAGRLTADGMLDMIANPDNIFMREGRFLLVQEFGKDHATYFSVLVLIAAGKTTRGRIESVLQKPVGGYLTKLQEDYRIVKRRRPMFSKPNTTNVHYYIDDDFLQFWFRFIYRNEAAIEQRNFGAVRELIDRDFNTFAGLTLEKMIRQQLVETGQYTAIGHYWDRKHQTEIDVIALDELNGKAIVGEVKMQAVKIDLEKLRRKAEVIAPHLQQYEVEYLGYSLGDLL